MKWVMIAPVLAVVAPAVTNPSGSEANPRVVYVGDTVEWNISATGTPPLTYQWYKDGKIWNGATGTKLSIQNVKPTDSGRFHVIVKNAYGTAPGNIAYLKVIPAPIP